MFIGIRQKIVKEKGYTKIHVLQNRSIKILPSIGSGYPAPNPKGGAQFFLEDGITILE